MSICFKVVIYVCILFISAYPLGVEDQTISKNQFNASSERPQFRAYRARLNSKIFAWFPLVEDPTPWIQVELNSNATIVGIQTHGFYRQFYDKSYYVETLQIETGDSEDYLSYVMDGNEPLVRKHLSFLFLLLFLLLFHFLLLLLLFFFFFLLLLAFSLNGSFRP